MALLQRHASESLSAPLSEIDNLHDLTGDLCALHLADAFTTQFAKHAARIMVKLPGKSNQLSRDVQFS